MQNLRGHTTGYAVPTYVIDGPGGGGKIPIAPEYIVSHSGGRYVLKNFAGELYTYVDPSYQGWASRIVWHLILLYYNRRTLVTFLFLGSWDFHVGS